MLWWFCVCSSLGVIVCSIDRLLLWMVWWIFSRVFGCRLNLVSFSVSSRGVMCGLSVILL